MSLFEELGLIGALTKLKENPRGEQDGNAGNGGDGPKYVIIDAALASLRPKTVVESHGGCGVYVVEPTQFCLDENGPLAEAQSACNRKSGIGSASRTPTGQAVFWGSGGIVLGRSASNYIWFDSDTAAKDRIDLTAAALNATARLETRSTRWDAEPGLQDAWRDLDHARTLMVCDPFGPSDVAKIWRTIDPKPRHLIAWWTIGRGLEGSVRDVLDELNERAPGQSLLWDWTSEGARYALLFHSENKDAVRFVHGAARQADQRFASAAAKERRAKHTTGEKVRPLRYRRSYLLRF